MGQFDDLARQASQEAGKAKAAAKAEARQAAKRRSEMIARVAPQWKSLGQEIASALRTAKVKRERDPNRMTPGRRYWRTPFGLLRSDGVWIENANRGYLSTSQMLLGMNKVCRSPAEAGYGWSIGDTGELLWKEKPATQAVEEELPRYIAASLDRAGS